MNDNANNGFPDAATLAAARALIAEACQFPRAMQAIHGMDAFCEPGPQTRVAQHGIIFGPCSPRDFADGVAGPLGRQLLKLAHSAPMRPEGSLPAAAPEPSKPSFPTLAAAPSVASAPPNPVLCAAPEAPASPSKEPGVVDIAPAPPTHSASLAPPSSPAFHGPGSNADLFDEEDDDYEGMDPDLWEEPASLAPSPRAPAPAADLLPEAPPAPPMTIAQIKAMMSTGASLLSKADPFESALADSSRAGACFSKRASWDSWGGQAKKSARASAERMGLRFENDPSLALCSTGVLALFPIDPGPLPAPGPDSMDAEKALSSKLDEQIAAAIARGSLCGAFAIALCGWGPRRSMAEARARTAGLSPSLLD